MTVHSDDRGHAQCYNQVDHERVPDSIKESREMTDTGTMTGRVIKVSKRGWGFISSMDLQFTRIFFHWTALRGGSVPFLKIEKGMHAEFVAVEIPTKGWRAVHVLVSERKDFHEPTIDQVPPLPE